MSIMPKMGPGLLVTAAFIGPGTITTASAAGANFGFTLLWVLGFAVFSTIVLQEMAARLGLVTRQGLADALRSSSGSSWLARLLVLLVIAAIGLGNAAYEVGNITGAALAASSVLPGSISLWAVLLGVVAGALLASSRYRLLERVLIALVLVMSGLFIVTAAMMAPPLEALVAGLFKPSLPDGASLTAIALVGTTVVPYSLFLHANAVREKWPSDEPLDSAITEARWDTGLSVSLGGLITLAIISTAAMAYFHTGTDFNAATMALQLEPLLGPGAKYFFAAGLLAGGLTSAITAPLASAYAVCGAMGWSQGMTSTPFRWVWAAVLVSGTVLAALGTRPVAAIIFAQVANGFLLPVVAVFLLILMNRESLLGKHRNGPIANTLGALVVLTALTLGGVKLAGAAGFI